MRRKVEPLKQKSMHLFVEAAHKIDDPTRGLLPLLALFTGVRVNTLTHIHADWFHYVTPDDGGGDKLYLKVPNSAPCRKYGTDGLCGTCNAQPGDGYSPKTDAGGGRRLKIPETWTDHYTGETRSTGLREWVERYFCVPGTEYGHAMFDGDGISAAAANTYCKIVAAEADIGFYRNVDDITHPRLGRIPDVFPHDLRATYCVQLMRNDANPFKAIQKTGHADVESLKPYISFAKGEIAGDFEDEYI